MQMNSYQVQTVTQIKFFAPIERPKMRRIQFHVEEPAYQEIVEIARYEGLDFAAAARELLAFALRYYKFKRGTLNEANPDNGKTFFCQICKAETKMRNMHTSIIMNEAYSFCETCFFANRYKNFAKRIIDQL